MGRTHRKGWGKLAGRSGQTIIEYTLIFVLVALVALAVLQNLGASSNKKFQSVNTNME